MSAKEQVEVKVETDPHGVHGICKDPDHRKLAICSIICGISCCGIMSFMYSVKVIKTELLKCHWCTVVLQH